MLPSDPDRVAQELDWARRIRTGDSEAFKALFDAYYERLVRFATHYLRSQALAEELVQGIFLSLWEQRGRWKVREAVHTYLYTMTRNRAMNALRRYDLEQRWIARSSDPANLTRLRTASPADEEVRLAELDDAIRAAIDRLPPRCREAFVLSRNHHLPYEEIARVMRISEKTVQEQIGRALKSLRLSLADWIT